MMFLSELYNASNYKETNKKISLQMLVEEAKNKNCSSKNIKNRTEVRFSQRGMVFVSKWDIKKITETQV